MGAGVALCAPICLLPVQAPLLCHNSRSVVACRAPRSVSSTEEGSRSFFFDRVFGGRSDTKLDNVSSVVSWQRSGALRAATRVVAMSASDAPADAAPAPLFPWDDPDFPWDERPFPPPDRPLPPSMRISKNDNNPVVVEIVLQLKKWEVVASDGKETFRITANIEMYWTDDRVVGFPTFTKAVPQNLWRPRLNGCSGFDLGAAEAYELVPRFYGYDTSQEHRPADGRIAMTFPVSLKEGFDISADMERFRSFPFDSTRVDLSIVVFGAKRPEFDKDIRLSLRRPNLKSIVDKYESAYQHIDVDGAAQNSNDYELAGVSVAVGGHDPPSRFTNDLRFKEGDQMPDYFISFHIKRSSTFYVHNGIQPMYTIAFFGFVGYAVEPSDLANRVALCAVLFLSIYAVQWTTVGHILRLPFKTVMDYVSESVSSVLMLILVGDCVAYHVARPKRGCLKDTLDELQCQFDDASADGVDLICGVIVLLYVLGYAVGYRTLFAAYRATKSNGHQRPWGSGSYLRNTWRPSTEAYHLKMDAEYCRRWGEKFLGQGVKVEREKW
jgi:hypothetical protein